VIHLSIPSVPPSINHMYMTIVKGKGKQKMLLRALTKEGRRYKNETRAYLAQNYQSALVRFEKHQPYLIFVRFHFVGMFTKGWPEKAKSRYKKLDVTNHLKAFEDVLSDVTGVDDSHNHCVIAHKVDDVEPFTNVWAWNMQKEVTPFNELLFRL
jgi:hypothetical protein